MSNVVKLSQKGSIGIVTMEEREYKNTFSEELTHGLIETFNAIRKNSQIKVVIIHGYDNYFCCGGTKKELIDIFEGKRQFTDLSFYDLLLHCEVPVIAAMQGHAIGGGLAFGSYADIILMGEENIYSANFMKYGFTPGMGATYIIPEKFGELLGTEMLMSAKKYYGEELKERGAPVKIVKKQDVIKTAIEIAEGMADMPVLSLKILKKHLTRKIISELPDIIAKELEMHQTTFAQPEVRQRIETLFGS